MLGCDNQDVCLILLLTGPQKSPTYCTVQSTGPQKYFLEIIVAVLRDAECTQQCKEDQGTHGVKHTSSHASEILATSSHASEILATSSHASQILATSSHASEILATSACRTLTKCETIRLQCSRQVYSSKHSAWHTRVSLCYGFFFLSCMQRGQYHFPFGFVVRPTHAKWNHSIGHYNTDHTNQHCLSKTLSNFPFRSVIWLYWWESPHFGMHENSDENLTYKLEIQSRYRLPRQCSFS